MSAGAGERATVCFVAPSAFSVGGVATWLDYVVPGLRAAGWNARVVLTDGIHHDADRYRGEHPAIEPVSIARSTTGTHEGRVRRLFDVLCEQRPDVVVSVNIPEAIVAATRLKAGHRAATGPLVLMAVHALEPEIYADIQALAPALDGVVCSNRLSCALARRASGLAEQRVHYAPYGVAETSGTTRPHRDRPLIRIGFAGRFEQFQKRVQDLPAVDAALQAAGVDREWIVAGTGPDSQCIEALASASGTTVRSLGPLSAAQMDPQFYDRCDVLFNPSYWETGPLVMWEAMARGVAVASSRYVGSGLEAALQHGRNCMLHDIGNCEDAAHNIAALRIGSLRTATLAGGHALIATRYGREHSIGAWDRALTQLSRLTPRPAVTETVRVAGRLDRWLGVRLGENLRALLGRRAAALDSGEEWPHTLSRVPREDPAFWTRAAAVDADGGVAEPAARRSLR